MLFILLLMVLLQFFAITSAWNSFNRPVQIVQAIPHLPVQEALSFRMSTRLFAATPPPATPPTSPAGSATPAAPAAPTDSRRNRKPAKDDVILVNGKIVEALPNAMFRVEIEPSKAVINASVSGKIRKNLVRIIMGDSVEVELSAYDLTKGRITFRHK